MADVLDRSAEGLVSLSSEVLYNRALGYGSFVMPSIVVLLIQQTLLIGVGMVAIRRRRHSVLIRDKGLCYSSCQVFAIMLSHIVIYGISLSLVLATLWPAFGFPFNGHICDIALLMLLYIVAASAMAQSLSYLFKRREAPILTLLWSSVPILLLAGVSYPKEAFPEWLYNIGRVFPSSSAVDGFIALNTMGAKLYNIESELINLTLLAFLYTLLAIILEKYSYNSKKSVHD
jgi:ABC-2 type transport system permease protein